MTTSLLGRGPCVRLGLIAYILAVDAHSVPKPGIGTLKGDPVKIVLKENAQPYSFSIGVAYIFRSCRKLKPS